MTHSYRKVLLGSRSTRTPSCTEKSVINDELLLPAYPTCYTKVGGTIAICDRTTFISLPLNLLISKNPSYHTRNLSIRSHFHESDSLRLVRRGHSSSKSICSLMLRGCSMILQIGCHGDDASTTRCLPDGQDNYPVPFAPTSPECICDEICTSTPDVPSHRQGHTPQSR